MFPRLTILGRPVRSGDGHGRLVFGSGHPRLRWRVEASTDDVRQGLGKPANPREFKGPVFARPIQLGRSCLLDLLSQELRPSLVTGLALARASLTPRPQEPSASPSLPSQLNGPGQADVVAGCRRSRAGSH